MGCAGSKDATNTAAEPAAHGTKILVLFYSTYGHCYALANAAAKGASSNGSTVVVKRVAETLPAEVLEKMHAVEAQKAFADVPIATVDELATYDGIIFVLPTRFGNVPAQMKEFLDATGQLWYAGALSGKVGSVMVTTATQHGGQEMTIRHMHTTLLHHGFLIVGMPNTWAKMGEIEQVQGVSPYGASSITGGQGQRLPSANELEAAEVQGRNVAEVARKVKPAPAPKKEEAKKE